MSVTLGTLKQGESGTVLSFERGAREYKQKLLAMGLTPGAEFTVLRVAPLGDPIEIKLRGAHLTVRKNEANIVHVEKTEEMK